MNLYEFLSLEIKISKSEILAIESSLPLQYKVYSIPKRSSGTRTIAHPSKKLKLIQRAIAKYLAKKLTVHKSSFAYEKGKGIKQNAEAHIKSRYLLKMDFQDFFHSITPETLNNIFLRHNLSFSPAELNTLNKSLFWSPSKKSNGKLILSIGAPSSPLISNSIMYFFDDALTSICNEKKITYTRYADDLTFSTNKKNELFNTPDDVRTLLKNEFSNSIRINEKKTLYSSKGHNRHVTGVTLTNNHKISVGRTKRREVSSLIHRFKLGKLSLDEKQYLQGQLSHCLHIEPHLKQRFSIKYSIEIITAILTFRDENA